MPFCQNCGGSVSSDQKFCDNCGAKTSSETKESHVRAPFEIDFSKIPGRTDGATERQTPRKGLLLTLAVAALVIVVAFVVFRMATKDPLLGKWYSEDGSQMIEFTNKDTILTGETEQSFTKRGTKTFHTPSGLGVDIVWTYEIVDGNLHLSNDLSAAAGVDEWVFYRKNRLPKIDPVQEVDAAPPVISNLPNGSEPDEAPPDKMPKEEQVQTIALEDIAPSPETDFEYKLIPENQIEIIRYLGKDKEVKIPEKIDGKPVIRLGGYSFDGTGIERLYIPDSVKEIGGNFIRNNNNVTEVRIPKFVESIGERAFSGTNIKEATLPGTLVEMGDSIFLGCQELVKINLENGITEISTNAFSSTGIKEIDLPETLVKINAGAFGYCKSLKNVSIPNSVVEMTGGSFDGGIFKDCSSLESVKLSDKLVTLPGGIFRGCEKLERIVLPSTLGKIGSHCFAECASLKEVIIPSGVEFIGQGSFSNCKNLKSVFISSENVEFDRNVFNDSNLLTIYAPMGSTAQSHANKNEINFTPANSPEEMPEL